MALEQFSQMNTLYTYGPLSVHMQTPTEYISSVQTDYGRISSKAFDIDTVAARRASGDRRDNLYVLISITEHLHLGQVIASEH